MGAKRKPVAVGRLVGGLVKRMTPPELRQTGERSAGVGGKSVGAGFGRVRGSGKKDLDTWVTYEAQARAIAMASDLGWEISRVMNLAVSLLFVQVRNPRKRQALIESLGKEKNVNELADKRTDS